MRRLLTMTIAAVLLLAAGGHAQLDRASQAVDSVTAYRPVGDFRLWTFVSRDSAIGTLTSRILERSDFDGRPAIVFESALDMDYNPIGQDRTMTITGERTVTRNGLLLAEALDLQVGDQAAEIEIEVQDSLLVGHMTRGDQELDVAYAYPRLMPAANSLFLDQYEMYFALRDLKVGDAIDDSLYVPRDGFATAIVGEVFNFSYQRRYQDIYDSVYSIMLTQPEQVELLFTPDKKLVKAIFPARDMRVYLDIVQNEADPATQPGRQQRPTTSFLDNLPHYVVYLIGSLLAIAFFIRSGYRWSISWVAYGVGAVVFWVIPYTQVPLQNWAVQEYFIPGVQGGGSPMTLAMLPSAVAGVIQEFLKLGLIFAVAYLANLKQYRIPIIGAILGGGFGFMEACYIISLSPVAVDIASWVLLERIFLIVFHTAAGAMLGQAISESALQAVITAILLAAVNGLWRYLPVVVQEGFVPVEIMYLLLSVVALIMLATALMVRKRGERARSAR